eukprot:934779-Pyramimonas_sp.AAC.1
MAMASMSSGLLSWVERAPMPTWWRGDRHLRMATDCTGLGAPEIAVNSIAAAAGQTVEHAWACDVYKPAQEWLRAVGLRCPILSDMNMRTWTRAGQMISTCGLGHERTFDRTSALDVYVSGCMCTPFTLNGRRKGWADEHAKTFWSSLKTIVALKPRSFLLENVIAA